MTSLLIVEMKKAPIGSIIKSILITTLVGGGGGAHPKRPSSFLGKKTYKFCTKESSPL